MRTAAGVANWARRQLGRFRAATLRSRRGSRGAAGRSARAHRLLSLAAGLLALSALLAAVAAGRTPQRTATAGEVGAAPPAAPAITRLTVGAPKGARTLPDAPTQGTAQPATQQVISGLAANGIPNVALNAYRVAAARMDSNLPGCGIDWSLLAGIGRVESNHGRFGGAVLQPDGTAVPKIIGPALDGVHFAYIADTDKGVWDTDRVYDRAVGPMQFIPATWRSYGVSAAGRPGSGDPANINDAALAAAHYLCVAGGDLRTLAGQRRAVMAYNHSDSYVNQVLALAAAYAAGIPVADLPPLSGDTTGPVPPPSGAFVHAPAAPGPAVGARDNSPSPPNEPTTMPASGGRPAAQAGQPAGQGGAQNAGPASSGSPAGGGAAGAAPAGTAGGTNPATGGSTGTGATGGSAGSGTAGGLPLPLPVPVPQPPSNPLPLPGPSPSPSPTPAPSPSPSPQPTLVLLRYDDPICVANRTLGKVIPEGFVCPTKP